MSSRTFYIDDEEVEAVYEDGVPYESLLEDFEIQRMSHIEPEGRFWKIVWCDERILAHGKELGWLPGEANRFLQKFKAEEDEKRIVDFFLRTGRFPGESFY